VGRAPGQGLDLGVGSCRLLDHDLTQGARELTPTDTAWLHTDTTNLMVIKTILLF
jgi:hypothetical protein